MSAAADGRFGFLAHPAFSCFEQVVLERLARLGRVPLPHELNGLASGIPGALTPWFDFAPEEGSLVRAAGGFDRFIARERVVPTRIDSYHDLLGALIWLHFTAVKSALHRLQLERDASARGPVENAATHFDESGVIVLSSRLLTFDSLSSLQWEKAFWEERRLLLETTRFLCFGHGLLDSLRAPHPRLMGKALFVHVDADRLALCPSELRVWLDGALSARLAGFLVEPACLYPLPVLGIPGWCAVQSAAFYRNTDYFRVARLRDRPLRAPAFIDLASPSASAGHALGFVVRGDELGPHGPEHVAGELRVLRCTISE